ncbi:DMT family transporter [Halopseudomonas xiamenensis]|uniref:DMT family transporter n=1 Tax=Halopseudomonas xiamenensis TaxID=157792 RepID=UPI0016256957|nr:DMT family transporter [Halopseudomonas xiamenensis]
MPVSLAYLGVVFIWGTTPLAIQWGALDSSFSFAAMLRMVLALVCALLVLRLAGIPLLFHARAVRSYLCAGLGLFLAMSCVYWASTRIDSGLMSVIFGVSPLVTSALAAWWLGESAFSPARVLGMLLGVGGLAVVFLDQGLALQAGFAAGVAALLVGVVCNSASLVGMKVIADDSHPMVTTTGSLLVAAPLFFLLWCFQDGNWPTQSSWRGMLSIAYLGVLGSVLGFAMYYYIIRQLSSAAVALILVITPLLALMMGRLFNAEQLPSGVWLGALLIGAGLLLYQWQPRVRRAAGSRV